MAAGSPLKVGDRGIYDLYVMEPGEENNHPDQWSFVLKQGSKKPFTLFSISASSQPDAIIRALRLELGRYGLNKWMDSSFGPIATRVREMVLKHLNEQQTARGNHKP